MTDEAPRKFVRPAHPGARIPDPAHPGLDLPAAGAEVPWDHHWIARERQGDVVIVEAGDAPDAPEPVGDASAAQRGTDGVPFMITKAQRQQLAQRGFSAEQIADMTPAVAQAELMKPEAKPA